MPLRPTPVSSLETMSLLVAAIGRLSASSMLAARRLTPKFGVILKFSMMFSSVQTISSSPSPSILRRADFQQFKDAIVADPRLNLDVTREIDYYAKQSTVRTTLITVLGGMVAAVMAIGAVFGALNTMYSAVAERGREIATMRALGFSSWNVILSFLFEALLISFVGGVLGCLAVLPLNGLTTSTMNFQTFSNLAFAFKITLDLLLMGVLFALIMGILGGMFPAIRAARLPVAQALRDL